ncbi:alkane 1-monooxygenase [Lacinutrix sp. C3R15]|uniref:alkane 1-monooxygenase n=1 Tax=Flavobacteriaceae TaxID=49546 RepID=UPI001C085230|nr:MULTISPECIES: alkane 1-monooxygenase [Flavobacteriaceae]MBU2938028.1 alkane 1-monooxygenase [Lacinutrix sp. C3R15]MDO6621342.1 alkane 1-monooxygenase [Oceanihabitans sp. 1_MG-2023]
MKDLKYLAAFSIPLLAVLGLYFKGIYVYLVPIYAFVLLPVFEMSFPIDDTNLETEEVANKLKNKLFDWLLYLNLPIVYGLLFLNLKTVASQNLETYEIVGLVISLGIVLAINGINVAHELGHRQRSNARFLGKALLLPSLYMHFYIEHNFGHHLHAATPEDPATAKYNQSVYSFWFTSTIRQYLKSWKIQKKLLNNNNKSFFSVKNDMFWFTIIQISYLVIVYLLFSSSGLFFALASAIVGFILLETVNYIEHYGLLRLKTKSGRYERVKKIHSWNSNHIIGRIVLYELTRHSDHHYKTTKKYQILDCHKESPQMPYGYPTSMLISLFPPLWFKIMNKRVPKEMLTTL